MVKRGAKLLSSFILDQLLVEKKLIIKPKNRKGLFLVKLWWIKLNINVILNNYMIKHCWTVSLCLLWCWTHYFFNFFSPRDYVIMFAIYFWKNQMFSQSQLLLLFAEIFMVRWVLLLNLYHPVWCIKDIIIACPLPMAITTFWQAKERMWLIKLSKLFS